MVQKLERAFTRGNAAWSGESLGRVSAPNKGEGTAKSCHGSPYGGRIVPFSGLSAAVNARCRQAMCHDRVPLSRLVVVILQSAAADRGARGGRLCPPVGRR